MGDYDDEQCLKMAALSRRIKIGDTYDFVNDIVTRGKELHNGNPNMYVQFEFLLLYSSIMCYILYV